MRGGKIMSTLEKYARGTLIKSEVTDIIYLITSAHTNNEPEFGRYMVLPLMNMAARALGLHEDSLYTVTGRDLDRNYYIIGKFDLDILNNYIGNEDASVEERLDKIESAIERIECKLCMRTAKRCMYDDGK